MLREISHLHLSVRLCNTSLCRHPCSSSRQNLSSNTQNLRCLHQGSSSDLPINSFGDQT
ncbi:hypothetical protein RchiOBHm_Chr7g0186401 [Rosa chinensis]|uniref:Uncharacterized protein n=1 Tax=Rosa chinensis TaxID=74649 RepID=A0A2P6P3X8_ROSCH|nr:hypothetical protein RchiOBHm_Chr7g0186401 [Rosa chinensis]